MLAEGPRGRLRKNGQQNAGQFSYPQNLWIRTAMG